MTLDQLKDMLAEYEAKIARNVSNPLIPHGFWSDVVVDLRDLIANGGVVVEEALFTLDGQHVPASDIVAAVRAVLDAVEKNGVGQWANSIHFDDDGFISGITYSEPARYLLPENK
jgi:hypothetical protein